MSLNAVNADSRLPGNAAPDFLAQGVDAPIPQRMPQMDETAKGPHVPGDFPGEGPPSDEQHADFAIPPLSSIPSQLWKWAKSSVPTFGDLFESSVKRFVLKTFPPDRQMLLYEATLSHPITATFIICQFICCGVPLLVFVASTFLFLAISIVLWGLLSLLLLGPVLLVASMTGVSIWGWGWVLYGFIKLTDKIFLNGMLTRFWLMQAEGYKEELETRSGKEQRGKTDGPQDTQ